MTENSEACVAPQVITVDGRPQPTTGRARLRRRGPVWLLLGVLVVGLGAAVSWRLAPEPSPAPGPSPDIAQLAALDDDTDQQAIATRLGTDLAAMSRPASAAQVQAACGLVAQVTRPLASDVGRWVLANCADDQEPHDGARYDIGPLDHE